MKKIISILLTIIMGIACFGFLAACGGEEVGPQWTTTGELVKDEDGNIVYDNVELRLTNVVTAQDKGVLEGLIGKFNRQYRDKITIISNSITESQFETEVAKRITNNNNAPDFIMSHQEGQKQLVDLKMLQPFDEALEKSGIDIKIDDYSTALSDFSKYGTDELYSIPVDAQSMLVLYNKDILAELGGALPKNHAELVALCARAKDANYTPIAWTTQMEQFQSYLFVTALLQNGVELYNENSYRAEWSAGENLQAFKTAINSIKDLVVYSPANRSNKDVTADFMGNKCLFYVGVPWDMQSLLESYAQQHTDNDLEKAAEKIGGTSITKWFAMDESKPYANTIYGDSHFFAMTRMVQDITKKAAICEFVKWFSQEVSVQLEWVETGHMSVCNLVTSSPEYSENFYAKNYVTEFYPDINNFVSTGQTPYFLELRTYLGQIILTLLSESNTLTDDEVIKLNEDKFNAQVDLANM